MGKKNILGLYPLRVLITSFYLLQNRPRPIIMSFYSFLIVSPHLSINLTRELKQDEIA